MRLIDADALKEQWDIMMYGEPHGCSFQVIDKQPTIVAMEKGVIQNDRREDYNR